MLDMGQEIRIDELARRLIRMRGLRPEVDIPIVYTGPRPGEKMHEVLLGDDEIREPTSHPHVHSIRSLQPTDHEAVARQVENLIELAEHQQNPEILEQLRAIVGDWREAPVQERDVV